MTTLVFLLEEPSAREALRGCLPTILPVGVDAQFLVYEGKQDLEKRMVRQMRAWQRPDSRFIVLRDQDHGDCRVIKQQLVDRCQQAGYPDAVVRIACRELEAWFIGDWQAVADAFRQPRLANQAGKARFRVPDAVVDPVSELRRLLPDYQKVDGARRIGPYLDAARSRSGSFRVFVSAVRCLVGVV